MSLPELQPILDEDLPEFCRFLTEHLSQQRGAEDWANAFKQNWCPTKPNNGFLIRKNGRIVGGIGAIYAERNIRGYTERFCNITSWCVLDEFRTQSMRLAMAVTGQTGFHFTDLTPTEVVSKTLQFLKFKPMDERHVLWPHAPFSLARLGGIRVVNNSERILKLLATEDAHAYLAHRHLPWLGHLVIGRPGGWCYVVWKPTKLKGVSGALLIATSDAELLIRYRWPLGNHLLLRHALTFTRVEARFLPRIPRFSYVLSGYRSKVFRSDSLQASDMSNLYSEVVALNL